MKANIPPAEKEVQLVFLESENFPAAVGVITDPFPGKDASSETVISNCPSSEMDALIKEKGEHLNTASKIDKKIAYLQKKQKTFEEKKTRIEWQPDGSSGEEVSVFINQMKKENRNYAYLQVQYAAGIDYHGNHHYRISCEHAEEILDKGTNPFTGKENSYGGMWGSGEDLNEDISLNRDTILSFLQGLSAQKRDFLKKPYLNPADAFFFTSVKGTDYRIFFDKKVKELFSEYGDVEQFIQYFNSLDNRPPVQEELDTAREYYRLDREIDELGKSDDIRKAVRSLFDLGSEYSCRKTEMPMSMAGKSLDELYQLHKERENRLRESKAKFEDFRKKIFR